MVKKWDFSGWATRNNLICGDGLTIRQNAFKDDDGETVPLVWNHRHDSPDNVLGHALLENRPEGVYAYCSFNDTPNGRKTKNMVMHGDISALSICANQIKKVGNDVVHGSIKELSLVLAGANPGAFIDDVLEHGDSGDEYIIAGYDENIVIYHSDDNKKEDDRKMAKNDDQNIKSEKTIEEIIKTMTDEQKEAMYALIGMLAEEKEDSDNNNEEGDDKMKHNIFDDEVNNDETVLCHADQVEIMNLARTSNIGSFQNALKIYASENGLVNDDVLEHSAIDGEVLTTLFPEYKDTYQGEPETLTDDQTWISSVINGTHKSPISRVRTRQLDARNRRNRAKGYQKGKYKDEGVNVALLSRTTDPQTIFVKDRINRDDIIDFTDFSIVDYNWKIMKMALYEELATAIMIGDGREEGAEDKIYETHVRSIWNDDELYTIHQEVDIEAAKTKLQGTNTNANFSDNYVYAEAIIEAALYAREKYKGSGMLTFYCTPHLLNVMLLARDMNGRRIYSSAADLQAALNVKEIQTVEQFEGLERKDSENKKHELLGIFVNLADYQLGSTKGGEVTKFEQFDIDFNQHKMLLETRVSGALTRVKSAIVLEKPGV